MEKTLNTKTLKERPKRAPLEGRSRLKIRNPDPNYHYRIVNANLDNDPDRVERLQDIGYEVVPKDAVGQVQEKRVDDPSALGSAGQISVGQGTKAVVMRIPKDWFNDDQRAKQAEIDEQEASAHKRADYGSQDITAKRTGT
jgi:hypothetical protein